MNYDDYFLASRTWLGDKAQKVTLDKTFITHVYAQHSIDLVPVLIGKTEKFYFILECRDDNNFKYFNALFNDDFVKLINAYAHKDKILKGVEPSQYLSIISLQSKLEKELSDSQKIVKRLKI